MEPASLNEFHKRIDFILRRDTIVEGNRNVTAFVCQMKDGAIFKFKDKDLRDTAAGQAAVSKFKRGLKKGEKNESIFNCSQCQRKS